MYVCMYVCSVSWPSYVRTYVCVLCELAKLCTYVCSVRNKEQVVDGQMSSHHYFGSDNFRFAQTYFGEVHICHSTCASTNNESISRHSQYK